MYDDFLEIPQNELTEKSVLGLIISDKTAYETAKNTLVASDFYGSRKTIYETIVSMKQAKKPIDIVTLTAELQKRSDKNGNSLLDNIGGAEYIQKLNEFSKVENLQEYIGILKDMAKRREVQDIGSNISASVTDYTKPVSSLIAQSRQSVSNIKEINTEEGKSSDPKKMVQMMLSDVKHNFTGGDEVTGLATGLMDLDKVLHGLHAPDLDIIAARPSVGKTAFALNIAENVVVKQHVPVEFFSLEMTAKQIYQRLWAIEGNINFSENLPEDIEPQLQEVGKVLEEAPIHVCESCTTISEIVSEARRMKANKNIGLIIIDYLQRIFTGNEGKKFIENRQQEMTDISNTLKDLAKELNVPIIALSQLSRGVESRNDKRPMLSDLRESGSIEQNADIVIMLYRDDYYNPDATNQNVCEVNIVKHRNGPIKNLQVYFDKEVGVFRDLSKRDEGQEIKKPPKQLSKPANAMELSLELAGMDEEEKKEYLRQFSAKELENLGYSEEDEETLDDL